MDSRAMRLFAPGGSGAGEKDCPSCKQSRPVENFRADRRRKTGLAVYCRDCETAKNRAVYHRDPSKTYVRAKRWHEENREKHNAQQRASRVRHKEKHRARKAAAYAANPEEIKAKLRDAAFRRKFGITLAERDAMAVRQGHRCAICGAHESELPKRLAVDHDHVTGLVRELLCSACNLALGYFKDQPAVLHKAVDYLQRHGGVA